MVWAFGPSAVAQNQLGESASVGLIFPSANHPDDRDTDGIFLFVGAAASKAMSGDILLVVFGCIIVKTGCDILLSFMARS